MKLVLGNYNIGFVIFVILLAPLPEGQHNPEADKAPGANNKDTADEKMDGKWTRLVDLCNEHHQCVIFLQLTEFNVI